MTLGLLCLGLASFQAAMVHRNLGLYQPPAADTANCPPISVLIPARDEQSRLPALLETLSRQQGVVFEVLVLDDNSSDATYAVASAVAEVDSRFVALTASTLPAGWAGKQHACHLLSQAARHENWLFLDADVRLSSPNALARISQHLHHGESAMQSGIPWQKTRGWAEQLIIPLIHLVLLGYLPFWEMRRNRLPALGAACGQMVAVKSQAYRQVGGHSAIRHRLHDATALAALFRGGGYLTDLFDATPLAECRMYSSAVDVFRGFAKNATEGMARPLILPLWTVLLLGANVLPWVLAATGVATVPVLVAMSLSAWVYVRLGRRYGQTSAGVLSRPVGVALFVGIQWTALLGKWLGVRSRWKGRDYARL